MASEQNGILTAIKELSVITVCVLASLLLLGILYYALVPSSSMLQIAREETLYKVNTVLDSFAAVNSNVLTLTDKDYMEGHFVMPLDNIQLSLMEVAANLVIFTDVLTDSFVSLNQLITTYNGLGSNLYSISEPEMLNRTVYQPLNTTITQVSALVEKLTLLAEDVSMATAPLRLARSLPLGKGAKDLAGLPLLSSLFKQGKGEPASQVDSILDDLMFMQGFDADIKTQDITFDAFGALKHVQIEALSLNPAGTNVFSASLAGFADALKEQGLSREEYLSWYYSIAALQQLALSGIGVVEDLEHILRRLPEGVMTPQQFSPEVLVKFKADPILRDVPQFISIKEVTADVRPARVPFRLFSIPGHGGR